MLSELSFQCDKKTSTLPRPGSLLYWQLRVLDTEKESRYFSKMLKSFYKAIETC